MKRSYPCKILLLTWKGEHGVPLWAAAPPSLIARPWWLLGFDPYPSHSLTLLYSSLPIGSTLKPRAYPPATDKKVIKLLNGTSVSPFPISAIHSGFGSLKIVLCCFMKQKEQAREHPQVPLWSPGPHSAILESKIRKHSQTSQRIFTSVPFPLSSVEWSLMAVEKIRLSKSMEEGSLKERALEV